MILKSDRPVEQRIRRGLEQYEDEVGSLPALAETGARDAFVEQVVESARRKRYLERIRDVELDPVSADPSSMLFDPQRAAVLAYRNGDLDEALWLLFLATYFGHHAKGGWRHVREVYGGLGNADRWSWNRVSQNVEMFRKWSLAHIADFRDRSTPGGFGNHRKYESFKRTPDVVASYVAWATSTISHAEPAQQEPRGAGITAVERFDRLYKSLAPVLQFGRTARFDYLSTAGRLGVLDVRPGRMYLVGATGPLIGAKKIVAGSTRWTATALDTHISRLDDYIDVGLDALEDAICNWQKSPDKFKSFRG